MEKLKNGKYKLVRMLASDGVKGAEFAEVMSGDISTKSATKGTNFDKHRDEFAAVMYSMKFVDYQG